MARFKSYKGFEQEIYASPHNLKRLSGFKGAIEVDGEKLKKSVVIDRTVRVVGAGSVEVKEEKS